MAYFNSQDRQQEEDYQPVFQQPVQLDDMDDYAGDDGYDDADMDLYDDDDDFLTEEERRLNRQGKWRMLAGLGDFLGVLAGMVVILVLLALLVSLINWVQSDIRQSFTLWQTKM